MYPELIDKYKQCKACREDLIKFKNNLGAGSIGDAYIKLTHFNRILTKYEAAVINLNHLAAEYLNRAQYDRFQNVIKLLKEDL